MRWRRRIDDVGTSRHRQVDASEADETGLKICARAGYDPRLAREFLDRFAQFEVQQIGKESLLWHDLAAKGYTGPTWASTHPATEAADVFPCHPAGKFWEARISALKDAEAHALELFQQHKAGFSCRKVTVFAGCQVHRYRGKGTSRGIANGQPNEKWSNGRGSVHVSPKIVHSIGFHSPETRNETWKNDMVNWGM